MRVEPIPAFNDNIIWLVQATADASRSGRQPCIVVDPGDAAPVIERFERQPLALLAILLTHHHADHLGGVEELIGRCALESDWQVGGQPPAIWGPPSCASVGAQRVTDGMRLDFPELNLQASVLSVPGHTVDHVAYLCHDETSPNGLRASQHEAAPAALFCGDTLFAAGCGRLLGGTAAQLHASLERLAALPRETRAYPAHEYTLSNLQFAVAERPERAAITQRLKQVAADRAAGRLTLPTTIGLEKETNPFLMVEDLAAFTAMRERKDRFRPPAFT